MDATIVTGESYCRAESDRAFSNALLLTGGVNRFFHFRQVTPLEQQTVVRMNKDTLYSAAIVDTSLGATLTVPEMPDGRYCSVMLVDNDHYSCGVSTPRAAMNSRRTRSTWACWCASSSGRSRSTAATAS